MPTIKLDIVMKSDVSPERYISSSKFVNTLEGIINRAIQLRIPEIDVEINSIKAEWPGAPDNFADFETD
jgi:hypothetical protein